MAEWLMWRQEDEWCVFIVNVWLGNMKPVWSIWYSAQLQNAKNVLTILSAREFSTCVCIIRAAVKDWIWK